MSKTSQLQVRPWTPTPEQQGWLRATDATSRFLGNLPDEAREKYAGQWIAAGESEIIASAPTMADLFKKLDDPKDPNILMVRLEKGVNIRWPRS